MELTEKQAEGLEIAVNRYHERRPYTCIAGYAGTGKSTLIKFIISALEVSDDEVCYIAYTGKAANVLRQKGCANATTAHRLLYTFRPLPNGKFIKKPRDITEDGFKVIVVDEISMLPINMWTLLLSHGIYVLATGDPDQLPPVDENSNNHVLDNPHIFLDEIMRQAYDSEIIRLSMWVREGKPLAEFPCENKQVQIVSKSQVVDGMYLWADQILCATNKQRTAINNKVRALKGFSSEPEPGDKIINLRNDWDRVSSVNQQPLTNGSIGTLTGYFIKTFNPPKYIYDGSLEIMIANMDIDEEDSFNCLGLDYKELKTGVPTLNNREEFLISKSKNLPFDTPYHFAYAYAITTHKAQGSEWPKVLIFEEWYPNTEEEHRRWLYTAITRASDKVVIVKK